MKQTWVVTVESRHGLGGVAEELKRAIDDGWEGLAKGSIEVDPQIEVHELTDNETRRSAGKAHLARLLATELEAEGDRLLKLEALADAVRSSLCDMPEHPWIPGAAVKPVVSALLALDGEWEGNAQKASTPIAETPCGCGDDSAYARNVLGGPNDG